MKRRREICYLCNKNFADSRDHVPPECLFPDPKPTNLITLPCCSPCNRSYSKDEEYLRDNLSMISKRSRAVKQLWQKTRISYIRRPLKLRNINSRLVDLNLKTQEGIYLGRATGLKFDESRTNRVIEKIIKGLFFHHTDKILPSRVLFHIFFNPTDILERYFRQRMFDRTWNDVFYYAFLFAQDSMYSGFWWLEFYKSNLFLAALEDTTVST